MKIRDFDIIDIAMPLLLVMMLVVFYLLLNDINEKNHVENMAKITAVCKKKQELTHE